MKSSSVIRVGLNAAILAVTEETPRVLTVQHDPSGLPALPFGPLDPLQDRTLELGLRGWVRGQTALELGYVEQLYTFGDSDRDPYANVDGRVISVAYLALVREAPPARGSVSWRDVYAFLPWEDFREGVPAVLEHAWSPSADEDAILGDVIVGHRSCWHDREAYRSSARREVISTGGGGTF